MTVHLDKARAAWNGAPPAFVVALAERADRDGLAAAGAAIGGYSKTTVSLIIAGRYGANLDRVEAAVAERLGVSQPCPVLGEIDATRCGREQQAANRSRSLLAGMLRNACRTCPRRTA
ncbi:hypothetical protein A6A40_17155 (plasmid) [Azospirillum humicireducens]|uniref:Transcriptional regulator n=1 Tax=Azospirillum humicireducens TaxID=1226968 RepID=A0A2R4VQU0_9PROT|nr:hypothetical protein [Azospirillum humicireducens]AWB06782.1 hypothetical protein A6A40_17155 [Azospirillum humicireducens]